MSLLGIAQSMGVTTSTLQDLLDGEVKVEIATRLDTTTMDVQAFIDGQATVGFSAVMRTNMPAVQELRDNTTKETAIGIVIGLCIDRPVEEE